MDRDQSPNWTSPEDEDDSVDTVERSSFQTPFHLNIQELFASREEKADDSESDDDDDEKSTDSGTTRRFRKLFNGVFPKIASKEAAPVQPIAESAEHKIADLVQEAEARASDDNEFVPPFVPEVSEDSSSFESPSAESEVPSGSTPEADEPSFPETEPVIPEVEEPGRPEAEGSEPPEEPPEEPPRPPVEHDREDVPEPPRPPVATAREHHVAPAFAATPEAHPTVPAAPERRRYGGAFAAFLAAETLSRRRDRKLKREIKQSKKILETESKKNEQLRTTQTVQAGKVEKLESKTNRIERDLAPPLETNMSAPKTPETPPAQKVEAYMPPAETRTERIERDVEIRSSSEEHPSTKEELREKARLEKLAHDQEVLDRQRAFEQWRHRKDKDLEAEKPTYRREVQEVDQKEKQEIPETFFEQRNEVKDEPTSKSLPTLGGSGYSASPVPIGSVIQDRQSRASLSGATNNQSHFQASAKSSANADLYKQSIGYGVGAALAILSLGLLAIAIF